MATAEDPRVTAAKGGVGAVSGAYGGYTSNVNTKKQQAAQIEENEKLQKLINNIKQGTITSADEAYASTLEGYDQNMKDYLDRLKKADYGQFDLTQPEEFTFDMTAATQAEMNPDLQAIIDRSIQGIQQEGAAGGSLFSGATGKNIARSTADITAKEWDAARLRAQTEQQNKYQQYLDKWNRLKDINALKEKHFQTGIENEGKVVGVQQQAFDKKRQEVTGATDTANKDTVTVAQNTGATKAAQAGMPSNIQAMIQGAMGGLTSALGG